MSRNQIPSRMEASAEQRRVLIYGRRPECTQRLGPVCTGGAGYITAPEQCAEQSVTPAAPADISEIERRAAIAEAIRTGSRDGYYDFPEDHDEW